MQFKRFLGGGPAGNEASLVLDSTSATECWPGPVAPLLWARCHFADQESHFERAVFSAKPAKGATEIPALGKWPLKK